MLPLLTLRLRKQLHDFKSDTPSATVYYDLREDWNLIESSFAKQYGIRLRSSTDMPWSEFMSLLSGLMPDTPLGSIIAIRSESDPKVIKQFNSDQKRIRNEWNVKQSEKIAKSDPKHYERMMEDLSRAFAVAFGKQSGGETDAS